MDCFPISSFQISPLLSRRVSHTHPVNPILGKVWVCPHLEFVSFLPRHWPWVKQVLREPEVRDDLLPSKKVIAVLVKIFWGLGMWLVLIGDQRAGKKMVYTHCHMNKLGNVSNPYFSLPPLIATPARLVS